MQGTSHTVQSDKVGFIVVDMQPSFLRVISDSQSITRRCAFVIEAAKLLGFSLCFTEQVPEKLQPTLPPLRELASTTPVFSKTAFSALESKEFYEYIKQQGINHLVLIGIELPICLYQTASEARKMGLMVTLIEDAVGARRPQDMNSIWQLLDRAGCCRIASEPFFYAYLRDTKHPQFSAFNALVKKYN